MPRGRWSDHVAQARSGVLIPKKAGAPPELRGIYARSPASFLFSYVLSNAPGMGVCSAGPSLLTVWVSWLKRGLVLRVLGVPIALFAWHLEVYGYSQTSLVLQRLSQRIRFPTLFLFLQDHDMSHFFFVGGADVMDHLTEQNTRAMRKRASTQNEVGRFFASGVPSTPMAPPPAKQFETPSNSTTTNTLSELSSIPSTCNSDSMTYSAVTKQGKRLSLHFPIQPAAGSTSPRSTPRSRPQSWITTPITSPEIAPSPTEGNFLTVLAAQERRVFELKEELVKAEQDLEQLKRHWATHEAMKKRNDVRRVQQLQPLTTPFPNFTAAEDGDEEGSPVWLQKEMERRKALLSNTKISQRKVFSGSRHTRTLSLLSPDKTNYSPSFPQPADIRQSLDEQVKRAPLARSSTTPNIATQVANTVKDDKYDLGGIQRDVILRTGKQMASDFKDGLLTLIEDLRQATVGEEAINGVQGNAPDAANGQQTIKQQPGKANQKGRPTLNQANSSKVSKDESPDLIDIEGSFWKEHGLNEPPSTSPARVTGALNGGRTPQKVTQKLSDDFEDSWDTWDTPNDKYIAASSGNSSDSDGPASPTSARSSPRTSTRYVPRRFHSQPTLTNSAPPVFQHQLLNHQRVMLTVNRFRGQHSQNSHQSS